MHKPIRLFLILALSLLLRPALAQEGQPYAVLIGGLGGSPEYTEKFKQYLFESHRVLIEQFQYPEANVVVLGETSIKGEAFVDDVALAENIRARFSELATRVTPDDHVLVLLFGHGSFDGQNAQLNIPRRDLNDTDYADLIGALNAGRVVFVNTASASAPFIEAVSGPDRIVITATKSGTQRNETVFPKYLVEALASPAADFDKNGDLSVREVFVYASQMTTQYFESTNHLATEHPMLDDTGDRKGFRAEALEDNAEGNLAAVTYMKRRSAALAASGAVAGSTQQLREREDLEREIAALKSRKAGMEVNAYYAELETLFVRLARLNDALESGQNP